MSMPGILECSLSLKEKPTAVCDKNKPFFVRRGQWTVVNNVRAWQMHALNSCVNAIKRQMDPRTSTHTHFPVTHSPCSAPSPLLCTSYNSLSGFET